jgi:hypothetical protein
MKEGFLRLPEQIKGHVSRLAAVFKTLGQRGVRQALRRDEGTG